ncbi:1-acyl-sn-glycerol-3-phosphate acyltransferase [Sanguibacter sp. HDW7]|nr:1-acyl-sn-glycerol-3-phosphate acyltransferase [Sanguibacter sp. HDW7]
MRSMTRRDWQGQEHLPTTGGFVVAGNHMSNIDPLTFAHYVYDAGFAPRILAKASLFEVPVLGALLRATGQIPVERNSTHAHDALGPGIDSLRAGRCVAVFPEGTLTRDPDLWPMTAKTGVARLALEARVPVIPVAQWGMQDILPRYSKRFRPFPRKHVSVHAGPPVDLDDLYGRPLDTATLREATERVMDAITAILADIRGEEPPAVRYDMRAALRAAQADPAKTPVGPSRGTPADDPRSRPETSDETIAATPPTGEGLTAGSANEPRADDPRADEPSANEPGTTTAGDDA